MAQQKAYVRAVDGDTQLSVTLFYGGKQRTLNRPVDEPVEKAIARLRANIVPKPKEKRKKGKADAQATPTSAATNDSQAEALPIILFEDTAESSTIPVDTPSLEAWRRARVLQVGEERLEVVLNPPTVEKVSLPRRPMVGYPVLARAKLQFADPSLSQWSWARRRGPEAEWEDLGWRAEVYTPTPQDVGCALRVDCVPGAAAPEGGAGPAAAGGTGAPAGGGDGGGKKRVRVGPCLQATSEPVEAPPPRTSASVRCVHTPLPAPPPSFRIMTYNILADQYAGSTHAQTVLFNYCPLANLDPDYRRQLVLEEVLGYKADIVCLQEVDEKAFSEFLRPHLEAAGYSGHFTNKQGKVREGSATFWRTSRFTRVLTADILLRDMFRQPLAPAHAQWQPMLAASPGLVEALQKVTTIAQATLLVPVCEGTGAGSSPAQPVTVVNTHLFFHPYAPHIRVMHTAAILEEVSALLAQLQGGVMPAGTHIATGNISTSSVSPAPAPAPTPEQAASLVSRLGGKKPTVLFCGDLNSDLNDGVPGVVELLQTGELPSSHWDWAMGASFKWGQGDDGEGGADQQPQPGASQPPPNEAIAAAVAAAKAVSAAQEQAAAGAGGQGVCGAAGAGLGCVGPSEGVATQGGGAPQVPGAAQDPARRASLESTKADDGHAFQPASSPQQPLPVTGVHVVSPWVMRSADDLATPFTNYTNGYKALLDYVWYQPEHLRVVKSVPVPTEEELGSFIPSPSFPSDHLAVVYDLEWRQ